MDCGLCWGVYPNMTADEINYVVEMVRGYFGYTPA
jgi:dTDP-4-amino-4,6-dideoxygalactose transaminase